MPGRSIQDSSDRVFLAVDSRWSRLGVLSQVLDSKRLGQFGPTIRREAERHEKARFESPDRMSGRQQVVAQLLGFDRGPIGIGDQHGVIVAGDLAGCVFADV